MFSWNEQISIRQSCYFDEKDKIEWELLRFIISVTSRKTSPEYVLTLIALSQWPVCSAAGVAARFRSSLFKPYCTIPPVE